MHALITKARMPIARAPQEKPLQEAAQTATKRSSPPPQPHLVACCNQGKPMQSSHDSAQT